MQNNQNKGMLKGNRINSASFLRTQFRLTSETVGVISEIHALGIHYHTLDNKGNCIKGMQYILKSDFNFPLI